MDVLTDGVVTLRPLRQEDVPAIAVACADHDVARFIPGMPVPYTEADARTYVTNVLARTSGAKRTCAIADAASDEILGAIEVRLGEVGSTGYWIAPSARGRGIATRALRLLSHWAVTEGGVRRLELTTHLDNLASQRVAEKAGFVRQPDVQGDAFRDGSVGRALFVFAPDCPG